MSVEDHTERLSKLRSLLAHAESQPPTEQTAYDLDAIRKTLELAEAELRQEIERAARRRGTA